MEFGIFQILVSVASAMIFMLYSYFAWSYDYWEKRGVPGPKPSAPFGNSRDVLFQRKALVQQIEEFYDAHRDEPFFGYFMGRRPVLHVSDPELIKHVLIKDFHVFYDRGIPINESSDPLSIHMITLAGDRWKALRSKFTPVFTTGKLRHMYNFISECADKYETYLKDQVARDQLVECREHAARYSTDVIGSCAFGIQTNALDDESSEFREAGRKFFASSLKIQTTRYLRQISPRLFNILRLSITPPEVEHFFINTMRETVKFRQREKIVRNDFVDVLMNIMKEKIADGFEWTDSLMAAQAFSFFAAGFETASTTISFTLYELARTPEVQERLRQEILDFDRKFDGKIPYESINEMKYLDMVMKESMRKNPAFGILTRVAMDDYVIPGTAVKLEAGQFVQISVHSLHKDPRYYPNPEVFDPERFSPEGKRGRHPMVYLPFGEGPKNCIGMRFANYQVKLALIKVIKNFRLHPTTSPDVPYVIDKNSFTLAPVGGVTLRFEPLAA